MEKCNYHEDFSVLIAKINTKMIAMLWIGSFIGILISLLFPIIMSVNEKTSTNSTMIAIEQIQRNNYEIKTNESFSTILHANEILDKKVQGQFDRLQDRVRMLEDNNHVH